MDKTRHDLKGSERGFRGSLVAGYIRSPKRGDPLLDDWETQIRMYATAWGYNLAEVIRDDGISAVAAWKPGLASILRSNYAGVITPSLHQLGVNEGSIQRILRYMYSRGIWIVTLDQ
jgi:hypothetical protein